MTTKMAAIRKQYRVPAKRGMIVRCYRLSGRITGTPRHGMYINVLMDNGNRFTVHPYEMDYLDGDQWILGEEVKKETDARWDAWNNGTLRRKGSTK